MSNITVCARFRPLSSKERKEYGDSVCVHSIDSESFVFKDEKEEESTFSFDRVFYEDSVQADVYGFLALPIVRDAFKGINGTIITYGQTGAGKTYSVEGPDILDFDDLNKGLLPRVIDGLFEAVKCQDESTNYLIKLSMVEIYMEKVRDLLDFTKENIQIKESKVQGILLSGVTEIPVSSPSAALESISTGIVNRAVGETQMNMASSRSHCIYMFTVQQECTKDKRTKTGKVVLVDLAGSEKVEKTGAEGKILEEAKMINKSLSALGNVINALTCSPSAKSNHIPYRDSKLTRILQDALGGNSKTGLLCCCSPSSWNASETLSTLRFGTRAKHIKSSPIVTRRDDKHVKKRGPDTSFRDDSPEMILDKLMERLGVEDVKLLQQLFIMDGVMFNPNSFEDPESAYEVVTSRSISLLQRTVEELLYTIQELEVENEILEMKIVAAEKFTAMHKGYIPNASFLQKILYFPSFFLTWIGSFIMLKTPK